MDRKDSLVAINLIINGALENKNGVPMLYYWDGNSDLTEQLKNDIDFRQYLINKCLTVDNYTDTTKLSYIYFRYIDGAENYVEDSVNIQDLFKLSELSNDEVQFVVEYIKYYFNFLYKCAFKVDYNFTDNLHNDVNNIYNSIKDKYPERVIKETVINYINAELTQTKHLSNENSRWIMSKVEKILNKNNVGL